MHAPCVPWANELHEFQRAIPVEMHLKSEEHLISNIVPYLKRNRFGLVQSSLSNLAWGSPDL